MKKAKEEDLRETYLNRSEFSVGKHVRSLRHTISSPTHLATDFGVPYARANLPPVATVRHSLFQPTRIVLQIIVQIRPVLNRPARPFIRDDVGKYDEASKRSHNQEHSE